MLEEKGRGWSINDQNELLLFKRRYYMAFYACKKRGNCTVNNFVGGYIKNISMRWVKKKDKCNISHFTH